jgi:hypothetical protein
MAGALLVDMSLPAATELSRGPRSRSDGGAGARTARRRRCTPRGRTRRRADTSGSRGVPPPEEDPERWCPGRALLREGRAGLPAHRPRRAHQPPRSLQPQQRTPRAAGRTQAAASSSSSTPPSAGSSRVRVVWSPGGRAWTDQITPSRAGTRRAGRRRRARPAARAVGGSRRREARSGRPAGGGRRARRRRRPRGASRRLRPASRR